MNDLTLFLAGSAAIVWLSRKPLRKPGSHGFYRFFAWEAILGLIVYAAYGYRNSDLARGDGGPEGGPKMDPEPPFHEGPQA